MELFKASEQWKNRPADERFWNAADMYAATKAYADSSREATIQWNDLRVEPSGKELVLVGKNGAPALMTNYFTDQFCQRVKAPANYIRRLPVELAAENLNTSLKLERQENDKAKLLLHSNGSLVARCITGVGYQRIWNFELAKRLMDLEIAGWRNPPAKPCSLDGVPIRPATAEDCLKTPSLGRFSIKVGDPISPAGLYAGDRDAFVFMINESALIQNPADPEHPLARGFFLWNSEVGDKSFGLETFLFDAVCSNHIVWGAQAVRELRVWHVGEARAKMANGLEGELLEYADSSLSDDNARIQKAQTFKIPGADKDSILEYVMGYIRSRRIYPALTLPMMEQAYDIAEATPRYGSPNTPWALASGVTEISQKSEHAERRVAMDTAAGKLLEIAF
jgi:hypothetical protein